MRQQVVAGLVLTAAVLSSASCGARSSLETREAPPESSPASTSPQPPTRSPAAVPSEKARAGITAVVGRWELDVPGSEKTFVLTIDRDGTVRSSEPGEADHTGTVQVLGENRYRFTDREQPDLTVTLTLSRDGRTLTMKLGGHTAEYTRAGGRPR